MKEGREGGRADGYHRIIFFHFIFFFLNGLNLKGLYIYFSYIRGEVSKTNTYIHTCTHIQKQFRKILQSNGNWMVKQNSSLESGCLATRTTMFLAWPHGLILFFKALIIARDYPVVWINDSLCVFVRAFDLTGSSQHSFYITSI